MKKRVFQGIEYTNINSLSSEQKKRFFETYKDTKTVDYDAGVFVKTIEKTPENDWVLTKLIVKTKKEIKNEEKEINKENK